MSTKLYIEDTYSKSNQTVVCDSFENEIILDQTVFYPHGGGQPGDTGELQWNDKAIKIINTYNNKDGSIVHVAADMKDIPRNGDIVITSIDWVRRYLHMRMHTGLHLLGSVLKYGVTGGNISSEKSRLDFDMEEPVDKEYINSQLEKLVSEDHQVTSSWITQEELKKKPELIRTMSVRPPENADNIRLVKIGSVDLQPCGGTHVKSTGEVGKIVVSKVEKKGKRNRRVNVKLMN